MNEAETRAYYQGVLEGLWLKFVKEAGVQHFTVHKTNCAGIGYTLEVEYPQTQFGKSGTFKAELVGVDQW